MSQLLPDPLPWPLHPTLAALLPRLQLVQDCWQLLAGRREHYLPRGKREPESAYRRRVDAAEVDATKRGQSSGMPKRFTFNASPKQS